MAAALLALLLAAPAPPEIPVKAGAPIALDGRIDEAEWADAFSITRDVPGGGKIRFRMKRTGPWLALGLDADGAYRGEVLRLYATDAGGAWITTVILGLGQPALPPALWRRVSRDFLADQEVAPPEAPRGCLVRLDVTTAERWSAEALLRLGTLGIARGDIRDLRGIVSLHAFDPEQREVFTLPGGARQPSDVAQYARLVSTDGWGAAEAWPPVTQEQSREFDDGELLHRLSIEHEEVSTGDAPERLVIATAVRPRSMSRIGVLRLELEAARARNPTLPSWTYFLGRLLHEANLYDEARKVIESIPKSLRAMDTFANLVADHYLDTGQFDLAEEICRACPYMRGQQDILELAVQGRKVLEKESAAVERDARKGEKNPRVSLRTNRGTMIVELFEDDAPAAVRNFMDLVLRRRYYDGLRFHDVQGSRLATVGDPSTRPGADPKEHGPVWRVKQDPSERGLLGGYLALLPTRDGGFHGSQFLIAIAPLIAEMKTTVVFGRVVEGMDVLLKLEDDDLLEEVKVLSQRNHSYDAVPARMER